MVEFENVTGEDIKKFLYFRRVISISRIIDGDTIILVCDQGKRSFDEERYRLYGINTPENRKKTKEAYEVANAYFSELISNAKELYVNTFKDKEDSFGRWLAVIYDENGNSLNKLMVDSGHAIAWKPK
jgi:micrococcal nuclease